MKASIALLVSGLAVQQVAATWNRHPGHFNTPQYNDNKCTDKQKNGYNWQDVPKGDFKGYDDFEFKGGWKCADSFGKRDHLTKRTFNSKCIKNKVRKDKPAAFDCKGKKEGFSIKEIQVSVEYDADIEFHYKMPDNSICKHIAPCKKDGSIVKNTQCGGAREVEVYLGKHNKGGKEDCEIGFHHIDFDCNPGYVPPPYNTPPSSTPHEETTPPVYETTPPVYETTPPVYETTPPAETSPPVYETTPPAETSPPVYETTPPADTTTPPVEYPTPPYNGTTPPVYESTPPAESTPPVYETTPPAETTPPVYETTPPVYETTPPSYETTPESSTPVDTTVAPSETPSYTPTPPDHPGYTPPECLPKCMNTWISINSKCKDNTDSGCYCKNPEFTKSVIECVAAWATDDETQKAIQYLLGICAAYVPENPGLITDCPTYIPINPTPSGETPVETTKAPEGYPVTTVTYETTVTITESESTVYSTIQTYVTVPQVIFTSYEPAQPPAPGASSTEAPVVLVPGTPAPAPVQTTVPPYPYPSNDVPTSLGTVTIPTGAPTSTSPSEFEGAASSVSISFAPALIGAVLAFFAL